MESLNAAGVGDKGKYWCHPLYSKASENPIVLTFTGIVFQFARVGNDKEAEEFLKHLGEESSVKDYVDTLSGSDLMTVMGTRAMEGERYTVNDLQMVCATEWASSRMWN